jgi:hypothetical protein
MHFLNYKYTYKVSYILKIQFCYTLILFIINSTVVRWQVCFLTIKLQEAIFVVQNVRI